MNRSDLFCENSVFSGISASGGVREYEINGAKCVEAVLEEQAAEGAGIAAGKYFTVYAGAENCEESLFHILRGLIPESGSVLVVGLGNERMTADSLGVKSLRFIPATAHLSSHSEFSELGLRKVYVLETGVTGQTGIESAAQVRLIAKEVGVSLIIAVDSLACSDPGRLCRTVQVTDTGIAPGAGVGNSRKALNEGTMGVKVVAVGVPTVIDYETESGTFMVTPRNIDLLTDVYSRSIGGAISRALNPALSREELSMLVF